MVRNKRGKYFNNIKQIIEQNEDRRLLMLRHLYKLVA